MKFTTYLRLQLTNSFIPLVKKDKCEICQTNKDLCVHHVKPFIDMLKETLQELNLPRLKNDTDYNVTDLNLITNTLLGKHLKYQYMTVCQNCHRRIIHKEGTVKIGGEHKKFFIKRKLEKEAEINKKTPMLEQYLEKVEGEKLFDKEQQELSNFIIDNFQKLLPIDYRTKLLRHKTIEYILREQLNLNYAINKKRLDKIINGKRVRKSYIIITKIK